jgi:hypothetical protein
MALNSSGPLSFGGSTTGQSINLELGVSATALASINSTAFRTLAGVASGQISVSNFYGKSNGPRQWMAVTHANQSSSYPTRNFYDSSGNAYVAGAYTPSQVWQTFFQKWNASNVSQFSNTYVPSSVGTSNSMGGRSFFDSSGNMYFYGLYQASPNGTARITKVSSAGTAQWSIGIQSNISFNSFKQTNPRGISANSSKVILTSAFLGGNITGYNYCYCPPSEIYSYTTLDFVTNYAPSNGAAQWTYNYNAFSAPFNYVVMQGVAQLSTGVIVLAGGVSPTGSGGSNKFSVIKLASDGSVSSAAYFNMTPFNSDQPAVEAVVDSADNLVYSGDAGNSGYFLTVQKINTASGTPSLAWAKLIDCGVSSGLNTYGVAVDPNNNVYVVGFGPLSGATQSFICKFNSAGTLQFAQRIQANYPSGGAIIDIRVRAIYATSTTMYLSFEGLATGASYAQYNLAVANDGSVTGVTTVNYPPTGSAGVTFTIANITPTVTNGSLGSGTAFTPSRSTPSVNYPTSGVTTNAWTSQQTVANI